jgi:hypothetical protein
MNFISWEKLAREVAERVYFTHLQLLREGIPKPIIKCKFGQFLLPFLGLDNVLGESQS